MVGVFFFFFKQKTAYEIYQCDWSSDVCSSDLTSVRQTSIPISVLLGGMFLKEIGMGARLAWALVLSAGIAIVVLSR